MASEGNDIGKQDTGFLSLPARLRNRIDRAFDAVTRQGREHHEVDDRRPSRIDRSLRRQKFSHGPETREVAPTLQGGFINDDAQPGGFIVDEPQLGGFVVDEPQAGGFIVDDTQNDGNGSQEDMEHVPSRVPLALIPSALQLLDLQPDDEDVLSVFRNAASGWDDSGDRLFRNDADVVPQGFVSRSDWRAVCAALLDTGDVELQSDDSVRKMDNEPEIVDSEDVVDDDPEGSNTEDAFVVSDEDPDSTSLSEASDDEYVEGGFIQHAKTNPGSKTKERSAMTRKSARASRFTTSSMDEDDIGSPKGLILV